MMVSKCRTGLTVYMATLVVSLVLGVSTVAAQTTTGTIRGFVRTETGEPAVGAEVVATQTSTNLQRTTQTQQNGFFNLSGLQPGTYEVQISMLGYHAQPQDVRVLVGQTISSEFDLTPEAIALEEVVVRANRVETRTQEVATNITQEQVENVPINDRNFLSLALLVPGVRNDRGSISAGGQDASNINVFVDGVSYKNDMLQGGIVGQDASQGNPFPQAALQEFRVITQQYKAEYQKATGAVVSATTKSGTNEWHGEAFMFGQNSDVVAKNFIQTRTCSDSMAVIPNYNGTACADLAKRDKWQGGVSLGGPIIRDRLFFFGTYEGNHITWGETVSPHAQRLSDLRAFLDANPGVRPNLADSLQAFAGTFDRPLRSNLYFGKLTYVPTTDSPHRFELSTSLRDEFVNQNIGGLDAREAGVRIDNDVNTFALKHQYAQASFINELSASFQRYRWHPAADSDLPTSQRWQVNDQLILRAGSRSGEQNWVQDRMSFRDDFTYTLSGLLGDHVFKLGGNLDFLDYQSDQRNNIKPVQFWNSANNYAFPQRIQAGFGEPGVTIDNTQLGFYIQDDWTVSSRLTLNLGIRWDYESNDKNNDHVTAPEDVAALQDYVATLPCGQAATTGVERSRQLLCDLDRFTTNGTQRDPFMGAIQPRFGFSYDLFGDQRTVLFGGFGRYYDRHRLGYFSSEISRGRFEQYTFRFSTDGEPIDENPTIVWDDAYLTREGLQTILDNAAIAPGGQLHLYANDLKPPHTNQFTAGVRQSLGDFQLTANYTGVRGYDYLVALRANRNPDGTCCERNDPIWSNAFTIDNRGRTWYDALMLKAEKPYREDSPWGLQVSYTLARAEQNANPGDRFTQLNNTDPKNLERYPSGDDERHHLTTNWTIGLPFDARFSGIIDLGSGTPYNPSIGFGDGTDPCTHGNGDCLSGNDWPEGKGRNWWRPEKHSFIIPNAWTYRNVDLRIEKRFNTFEGHEIGIIAEVFNVFDFANFTGYDLGYGTYEMEDGEVVVVRNMRCPQPLGAGESCPVDEVPALGRPTGVITDLRRLGAPRRFQLGVRYRF